MRRRSSGSASGSLLAKRSVSLMTPTLKLLPSVMPFAGPSVISTLPPPMSMHDGRRGADVDAVAGSEVDEPRFFRARDHTDANAGLPIDFGDEVAAVVGFAGRARGAGDDLVDLVGLGDAAELGQGLERGGDGGRGQAAAAEPPGAEPDHILFPVDDLKGQVGPDLNHDHVDRVGADVDGGDAHAGRLAGLARTCSVTRPLYTGGTGPSLLLYWPFFSKLSAILP